MEGGWRTRFVVVKLSGVGGGELQWDWVVGEWLGGKPPTDVSDAVAQTTGVCP